MVPDAEPPTQSAPTFCLRRATPADIAAIEGLIGDALAEHGLPFDPTGRDADVKLIGARSDHDDLVATSTDGRIVGVASVGPHGTPRIAWISKVFVARGERRRGLGRALLDAMHAAARVRGCTRVGLRTRVIFHDAIRLYVASGYTLDPRSRGARTNTASNADADDLVYYRDL